MKRLTLVLVLGLLVAACGGSGDESSATTTGNATAADSTVTTQPADDGASNDTTPPSTAAPNDDGAGVEVSTGSVTVAGETLEFLDTGFPGLQCEPESFGVAFLAALQSEEENDGVLGSMVVGIPFVGQEETAGILPAVSASNGEVEWIADPEFAELNSVPAGSSQVDSYEIDGNTISGDATFYEANSAYSGELVVEQGTFEVTCAG